jgi:hypothetical protein
VRKRDVLDTRQQLWYSDVVHTSLLSVRTVGTPDATTCQRCRPGKKNTLAPHSWDSVGCQIACTVARKTHSMKERVSWGRMGILFPVGEVEQDLEAGPIVKSANSMDNLSFPCPHFAPPSWRYHQSGLWERVKSQCTITDCGLAFLRQAINAASLARQGLGEAHRILFAAAASRLSGIWPEIP